MDGLRATCCGNDAFADQDSLGLGDGGEQRTAWLQGPSGNPTAFGIRIQLASAASALRNINVLYGSSGISTVDGRGAGGMDEEGWSG
jgi:hypothetical protein